MTPVHDATSRIRINRRRRTRRRLIAVAAGVLVLVLAAVGAWAVYVSSLMALTGVDVEGTSLLAPDEVRRVAAAPMGTPLARVAERPVAERVAALPPVASVTVTKKWPHALIVRVTERVPAYALDRGGRWQLVDASGVAYAEVGEKPADLVTASTEKRDRPVMEGMARVAAALPRDLGVERIEATSADHIVLKLPGREVLLGSADQIEAKVRVASALVKGTKAAWIDVSAPGHPATR